MSQIPANIAQVVAVFVECIFYGIYLVTFAASLRSIILCSPELTWISRFQHRWCTLMVVLSIFVLSTVNLALGLVRILALINHDFIGTGAVEQLGQDWLNIIKPLTFQVQTMIADCVLVYRCWIIYNKSPRVAVLPIIFYLGTAICTVLTLIIEGTLQGGKTSRVNGNQILRVNIGFWVSTISLNIYATSMIVLRIWRVESESRGGNTLMPLYVTSRPSRLQAAMKSVIESGLLYTTTSIVAFISLVTGSNSIFITSAIDMQTIGIAFNLILIRVNRRDEGTVVMTTASAAINFAPRIISNVILPNNSGQGVPPAEHFVYRPQDYHR
ncbi:hypothetical protein BDZ94DRAFT_1311926 [Collybia nuda]|uniref:Uncharacterized protein n=1 Tax=Collybia nuda TaxID=64659 RepID=A0A9P6CBV4_9AGAR|nr:hypothetical protein BDZ94DRAFT_1311926 [Collybia nuda]